MMQHVGYSPRWAVLPPPAPTIPDPNRADGGVLFHGGCGGFHTGYARYAPQLNPDAQVCAHVMRQVISALHRIQKLPAMVRAFFRQPESSYAAL